MPPPAPSPDAIRTILRRNLDAIRGEMSAAMLLSVPLQVLAEELLRYQLQTRLGAALRSRPAGWLLASSVWALLHVPRYWSGDAVLAFAGAAAIVPIGLLWGYASDRTASVWPATLAHAVNVWGLQSV